MKNIIYQYWQGNLKPGVVYSTELMKKYADKIGAEYRFDHNKIIAGKKVNVPIYYEPANPLVDDSFDEYDNVALIDIDVYPKDNLEENLFDQIKDKDCPSGKTVYTVNKSAIPTDRSFRDAWTYTE